MPKRGRPKSTLPKLPHADPRSFSAIWDNAAVLASTISDHYAMRRDEQKCALQYALLLEKGATFVELGVTHGHTAAIICYAAKLKGFNYYGIDNFTLEGTPADTEANLQKLQLPCKLIVGNTHTVPWDKPVDMLLIDGGHDVVNVTEDCLRWLPLVQPGGIALFHDYNPGLTQEDPHWGIKNAADTYTQYWETLEYMPYMLIKRKPLQ